VMNGRSAQTGSQPILRLLTLTLTAVILAACSAADTTDAGPANVLPHTPGASIVNVTCPDGVWEPRDAKGRPYTLETDGTPTTRIELGEGDRIDVRDPATGDVRNVICVPEKFPRLGENWIGRWATVSIMENGNYRYALRALMNGTNSVNSDENGAKAVYHQLVVDPNGVIRHYATGYGLPAALEHNPVTNGLIGYDEGTQSSLVGVPPTGANVLIHDRAPDGSGIPVTGRLSATDPALRLDWHDYAVLPDGNILAIGYQIVEETPNAETRLFRTVGGCDAEKVSDYRYTLRTRIVEYSPQGEELRTWRSEDHTPPTAGMPVPAMFSGEGADGKPLCALDIEHANAIDVTPDGDVIVGFRNAAFSAALVDWPSGTILWTLGGPEPLGLRIENDPFNGTQASHDARITRDGERIHLHLLDNNSVRGQSRYVRYRIDAEGRTATLVTETMLECHGRPCYSLMMGSASILAEDGDDVEILANTGSVLGEDLTVDLDGTLLHYRNGRLLNEIRLGDWWAYRVAVLPGEPWAEQRP
jgi:hypothetical protein